MSHALLDGEESQAVGFYGKIYKCERLMGKEIPNLLRHSETQEGSTLLIPGLNETDKWQDKIIAAVISNYFHAIHEGKLEVLVDIHSDGDFKEINAEKLPELFNDTEINKVGDSDEIKKAAVDYYNAILEGDKYKKDRELPTLGHCVMWIKIEEECSQSVAIIRSGDENNR